MPRKVRHYYGRKRNPARRPKLAPDAFLSKADLLKWCTKIYHYNTRVE